MIYKTIQFGEGKYCVRSITRTEDQIQAYTLRHHVFSQTLKWVPASKNGLDVDPYDLFAMTLGLFSEFGELLGLVRILPPHRPFMLEREFRSLVPTGYRVRKERDTVELSRLVMAPSLRHKGALSWKLSKLLYKGVYQWSMINRVNYIYLVVEKRVLRALSYSGFHCKPIGPSVKLQGGVESVAGLLDWTDFQCQHQNTRRIFFEWMTTAQSTSDSWPEPQHDHALMLETLKEYSGHEISRSVH